MALRKLEEPTYYGDYLHLRKLLDAQHPITNAHDEHLFIVTHQAYELWFKQVLLEIDSVRAVFDAPPVDERNIALAVRRLQRVREIFSVLLQQINVLETMSALDFLSFRDALFPASGFQSTQFRLLENKLGLTPDRRLKYGSRPYCSYLSGGDAETVTASESQPSLLSLVQSWLERTPFLAIGDFSWWQAYQAAVARQHDADEAAIRSATHDSPGQLEAQLRELDAARAHYATLFDEASHDELVRRGERTLSYTAMQAALLITLYGEEPMLSSPAAFLSLLVDVDEALTLWRHRHALMVHRMLGAKMGTGGSSGYHYLRATAERHKVFADLANLSTFLIPRTALPALPAPLQQQLDFSYSGALQPDSPRRRDGLLSSGGAAPALTECPHLRAPPFADRGKAGGTGGSGGGAPSPALFRLSAAASAFAALVAWRYALGK